MTYTAWSVVFGEQPSAAKWNQLGENDAGFRDGTNISDGVITPAHRSGGFYGVAHDFSTGTGTKTITGVPFAPKALIVLGHGAGSGTTYTNTDGYAVDGSPIVQGAKPGAASTAAAFSTSSETAAFYSRTPAADQFIGAVTDFTSDGIEVNVTTNAGTAGYTKFHILFLG